MPTRAQNKPGDDVMKKWIIKRFKILLVALALVTVLMGAKLMLYVIQWQAYDNQQLTEQVDRLSHESTPDVSGLDFSGIDTIQLTATPADDGSTQAIDELTPATPPATRIVVNSDVCTVLFSNPEGEEYQHELAQKITIYANGYPNMPSWLFDGEELIVSSNCSIMMNGQDKIVVNEQEFLFPEMMELASNISYTIRIESSAVPSFRIVLP